MADPLASLLLKVSCISFNKIIEYARKFNRGE